MTPAERPRFAALLGTLAEMFPAGGELSPIRAAAYWDALEDVPLIDLDAAARWFNRHRREPFLPVAAEWRAEALQQAKARRERELAGKLLSAEHDDNPENHAEVAQMVAEVVAKCRVGKT